MMIRFLRCVFLFSTAFLMAEESKTDVQQLIEDHTAFAMSFYNEITSADTSNSVFSPYSISTALSMTYMGARGDTADEIQSALHLSLERNQVGPAFLKLAEMLKEKSSNVKNDQLRIANALWVDQRMFVLSDFTHEIESFFSGKVTRIHFANKEKAIQTINSWVSDQTEGKIQMLLQDGDLVDDTKLVLTNAMYFQGSWAFPFSLDKTVKSSFYPTPDEKTSILMMQQTKQFELYENDLLQMVALPFILETAVRDGKVMQGFESEPLSIGGAHSLMVKGPPIGKGSGSKDCVNLPSPTAVSRFMGSSDAKMACVILLPKSAENLPLIEGLLQGKFQEWLGSLTPQLVDLQLPKFSISQRMNLNETLKKLGMEIPFTAQANFAGIDGKLDLYLDKVITETFFALDEAGVIAAAATAASIGVTALPPVTPSHSFIANHPFLFFIVDLNSSEVVIMGNFTTP